SADTYSARPGHSEHQTGLTMDITSPVVGNGLEEAFGATAEGQWIKENSHLFGFIIRYPQEQVFRTGYQYEPWHLRYVGVEVATEIYENNWILEDYILEYDLVKSL
ncbi:MAG: M15 family metallopeptidase, partial [Turicibacter sp.]